MSSSLYGSVSVGVVNLNVSCNLLVDNPRSPLLQNGALHGLQTTLCVGKGNRIDVNVSTVIEDAEARRNAENVLQVGNQTAGVFGVFNTSTRSPRKILRLGVNSRLHQWIVEVGR